MDWDRAAGDVVRAVRRRHRLTQLALAKASRVPQPTISEIEKGKRQPSLPLLARLVEAAQGATEIQLVARPRHSAATTADRIAAAHDGPSLDEDAALRAVIDLRDALTRCDPTSLEDLTGEPPGSSGDRRFDAFVAAVVEEAFAHRRLEPPGWTQESHRFIRPFWYLSGLEELRWWEFSTAPAALLRHGVLAAETELESV